MVKRWCTNCGGSGRTLNWWAHFNPANWIPGNFSGLFDQMFVTCDVCNGRGFYWAEWVPRNRPRR